MLVFPCWGQPFSCGEQGLFSSWNALASHFAGFSHCRAWAPVHVGFSSHGSQALVECSVFVGLGFSCYTACGIFLDQGSNLCPNRWILNHWTSREVPSHAFLCMERVWTYWSHPYDMHLNYFRKPSCFLLELSSGQTILREGELQWIMAFWLKYPLFTEMASEILVPKEKLKRRLEVELSCCSVNQLWLTHGLQHTSLPCPLLSPRVCSNSCPLSWWCHPTISSSVTPFSSCSRSFPTSGSFLMSWLFPSGGQNIGAFVSASVIPMNIQDWFPLNWLVWSPCHWSDS